MTAPLPKASKAFEAQLNRAAKEGERIAIEREAERERARDAKIDAMDKKA